MLSYSLCTVVRLYRKYLTYWRKHRDFQNLETIGTPFVMTLFALNSKDTIKSLSIAHSISGFLGFVCYVGHAFRKTEIIDFRKLLILAMGGFLSFHFLTIPLPFNAGHLKTYTAQGLLIFSYMCNFCFRI
jgi:hypothetical protein